MKAHQLKTLYKTFFEGPYLLSPDDMGMYPVRVFCARELIKFIKKSKEIHIQYFHPTTYVYKILS
jgi:hypothetical protein